MLLVGTLPTVTQNKRYTAFLCGQSASPPRLKLPPVEIRNNEWVDLVKQFYNMEQGGKDIPTGMSCKNLNPTGSSRFEFAYQHMVRERVSQPFRVYRGLNIAASRFWL